MILECLEGMYVTYTSEIFSDPRRIKKVFVEQYLGLFFAELGLFCHFVPGLLAIALSSRLLLFIWIAGIGLGTRLSEGHTSGCDWWISIRSVDNGQDWRKFWKRFRGCFVFQSRVSTKTVVFNQIRQCKNPKKKHLHLFTSKFNGFTGVKLDVGTDELTHILLLYSRSGYNSPATSPVDARDASYF